MSVDLERLLAAAATVRTDPAAFQACLEQMTRDELARFYAAVTAEIENRGLR